SLRVSTRTGVTARIFPEPGYAIQSPRPYRPRPRPRPASRFGVSGAGNALSFRRGPDPGPGPRARRRGGWGVRLLSHHSRLPSRGTAGRPPADVPERGGRHAPRRHSLPGRPARCRVQDEPPQPGPARTLPRATQGDDPEEPPADPAAPGHPGGSLRTRHLAGGDGASRTGWGALLIFVIVVVTP